MGLLGSSILSLLSFTPLSSSSILCLLFLKTSCLLILSSFFFLIFLFSLSLSIFLFSYKLSSEFQKSFTGSFSSKSYRQLNLLPYLFSAVWFFIFIGCLSFSFHWSLLLIISAGCYSAAAFNLCLFSARTGCYSASQLLAAACCFPFHG